MSCKIYSFDDENGHSELIRSSLSTLSSNSARQAQEENLRQIMWECRVLLDALTLSKKGSSVWSTLNLKLEDAHDELAGMLEDYVMSHSMDFSIDVEICDFDSMDQTLLLEDVQKYSTEWFLMKTAMKNLSVKVSRNSCSVRSSCSNSSRGTGLQIQTPDHNKSSNKSGLRRRYAGVSLKTMERHLRNKRKIT